jgi:hypothetical protein
MRPRRLVLASAAAALAAAATSGARQEPPTITVLAEVAHVGDDATDWPEGPSAPQAPPLRLTFESAANAREWTLLVWHVHVDDGVEIELGGRALGRLPAGSGVVPRESAFAVPAGVLAAGANELVLRPLRASDDFLVGRVRIVAAPVRDVLGLETLTVRATDAETGRGLPARVTVVGADGTRPRPWNPGTDESGERGALGLRDGLYYVGPTGGSVELPAGAYRVWVSRGSEWSAPSSALVLERGAPARLELELRREVDTRGWIAADTHVHTYEVSGHGDASLAERVLTLAGEGVELAVATDHNHQVDYRPHLAAAALETWTTPVIGNEITTDDGHFNAFPLPAEGSAGARLPDHRQTDWSKLVADARECGARVVILNHPRWPKHDESPFGLLHLDRASGARDGDRALPFDCIELVNATWDEPDLDFVLGDWFALLNRGERHPAVGSSDSHTVGDPVGQGRTYVPGDDSDPARIDVQAACHAFLDGRIAVCEGIFATLTVDGAATSGDLHAARGARARCSVRVRTPSWVSAERLRVFVDGALAGELALERSAGATDGTYELEVALPAHDCWLAAVVTGPPVREPFWTTLHPYTVGLANPVWIDRDGDGVCESPRRIAARLLDAAGRGRDAADAAIRGADDAVAIQLLDLARERAPDDLRDDLFAIAALSGRPALAEFAARAAPTAQ